MLIINFMRAKSDDLTNLMSTLSSLEQKSFIKYLRSTNSKLNTHLEKLYSTYQKLNYDEEKVKNKIKGGDIFKFYSNYKSRLLEQLQSFLVEYHKEFSIEAELHHLLQIETALRKRKLYSQSETFIYKAKEIANLYDYHLFEIEIIKREILILKETFPKDQEERLNGLISQKNAVLLKLKNEHDYRELSDKIFLKMRKLNECRDEETENDLRELMSSDLLINENDALNFWSKLHYNYCHARYNGMMKLHTKELVYRKRIVELWKLHPHRIEEKLEDYIGSLTNLINTYNYLNQYKDSEKLLSEVIELQKANPDNANFFQQISLLQIIIYMNTDQFEEISLIAPKIDKEMKAFGALIQNSYRLTLWLNLSLAHFFMNDFKNALKWVNKIVDSDKIEDRQDIQDFSKIFRLIIFYCSNKVDILSDYIRAAKRNLLKNNRLYQLEEIVLKRLNQLINQTAGKSDEKGLFTEFNEELMEIGTSEGVSSIGHEEIGIWLQSKIRNIPMRQILKESNSK